LSLHTRNPARASVFRPYTPAGLASPDLGAAAAPARDPHTGETFDELGLSDALLRGVFTHGLERPTRLQALAVRTMAGGDTLLLAPPAAGATTALLLAALACVDAADGRVQAVVVMPAREMAQCAARAAEELGAAAGVRVHASFAGGGSLRDEAAALRGGGAHVVVGTPGRVCDLAERGVLGLGALRLVALDGDLAGFGDRLGALVRGAPAGARRAVAAAWGDASALDLAAALLRSPARAEVRATAYAVDRERHYCAVAREADKLDALAELLAGVGGEAVVYCGTPARAADAAARLRAAGLSAAAVHSALSRSERALAAEERFLTTDAGSFVARIHRVRLVVHLDPPADADEYALRVGFAGRSSPRRVSVALAPHRDAPFLGDLERHFGGGLAFADIPAHAELREILAAR